MSRKEALHREALPVFLAICLSFRPFNLSMDSEAACPLLYMTVEIAAGLQDLLPVYSTDQPEVLAKSFCRKHGLPSTTQHQLARLVSSSMRSASRFQQGRRTVHSVTRTITRSQGSSVTPNRERRSEDPGNYGEWLYRRGQKATSQKHFNTQFRPSQVPSGSLSRTAKATSYSVDSLLQKGDIARQKLLARRRLMQQQERKQCPFRPSLSVKSVRLSRSRSSDSSAFDRLFQDAKMRTARLSSQAEAALSRECPFRPVTVSSRKRPETYLGIVERLMRSKLEFERAVAKVRERVETAQQPTFKPTIGRNPVERQPGPVYERLYQHHRVVERREEGRTAPGVDAKSQEIVKKYRRRQIQALFGSLDEDRDGKVQLQSLADLPPLDSQLIHLLSPLWRFLISVNSPVTFEAFAGQAEAVLATVSSADKAYVLRHMREGKEQLSLDRTSGSRETGASQRRSLAGSDVYSRQMAERSLSTDRLRKLREEQVAAELKMCTFRPSLTHYRRDPYLSLPL